MELRWPIRILVVLLLFLMAAGLARFRWFRNIEAMSYDLRARLVGQRTHAHEDIVIVAVDDESLKNWAFRSNWPWTDEMLVEIGSYCSQAKVQVYDVLFAEPKPVAPGGLSFAEFAHSYEVVLGVGVPEGQGAGGDLPGVPSRHLIAMDPLVENRKAFKAFTLPHNEFLRDREPGIPSDVLLGHVRSDRGALGIMRSYRALLPAEKESGQIGYLPALGVRAVAKSLGLRLRDISVRDGHLHLGRSLKVPCDEEGAFLFSEVIPTKSEKTYTTYAAGEILRAATNPESKPDLNPELFRDKIVLFGSVAEALYDRVSTPWRLRNGVEVHAEAMNTLLQQAAISNTPAWAGWALALLLVSLSALPLFERPLRMTGFYLIALFCLLLLSAILAGGFRLMLPLLPPILGLGLGSVAFGTNYWQRERRARRHHEQLEVSKQAFTDMLVHDLKNAMTPVVMFVDFMRMHDHSVPQPVASRLVDDVDSASKNALRLVENLLDIRRIQEGRLPLNTTNHELREYIEDRAVEFSRVVERSGKMLIVENRVPTGTICRFDPVILQRVLENLVWNAVKYGHAGKEIYLRSAESEEAGGMTISLGNHCDVLAPDFLESMFDAFITGVEKSSLIRSTGLGLAFCKMAISEHGASITAKSPMPGFQDGLEIVIHFPFEMVIGRKL